MTRGSRAAGAAGAVSNFARTVEFRPARVETPRSESDVLAILQRDRDGRVRVVGAAHACNSGIETEGTLVDMRAFRTLRLCAGTHGEPLVEIGAGCRFHEVLAFLRAAGARGPGDGAPLTLPTYPMHGRHTVVGAISTGTHGSGRPSLSHHVRQLRLATYAGARHQACIREIDSGDELRAARCALGLLGIVLSVRLPVRPLERIGECLRRASSLHEAMSACGAGAFPCNQFYLVPWRWEWVVQERGPAGAASRWPRAAGTRPPLQVPAPLYRGVRAVAVTAVLHGVIALLARRRALRALIPWFFRHGWPLLVPTGTLATADEEQRLLVLDLDRFRHVELELFVECAKLPAAAALVRDLVEACVSPSRAGSPELERALRRNGLQEAFARRRWSYRHHYPITFRRVEWDDALLSMTSGPRQARFALSLISYAGAPSYAAPFFDLAARLLHRETGARLHWGKWWPDADTGELTRTFGDALEAFDAVRRRFDPRGVFANRFLSGTLLASGR